MALTLLQQLSAELGALVARAAPAVVGVEHARGHTAPPREDAVDPMRLTTVSQSSR